MMNKLIHPVMIRFSSKDKPSELMVKGYRYDTIDVSDLLSSVRRFFSEVLGIKVQQTISNYKLSKVLESCQSNNKNLLIITGIDSKNWEYDKSRTIKTYLGIPNLKITYIREGENNLSYIESNGSLIAGGKYRLVGNQRFPIIEFYER